MIQSKKELEQWYETGDPWDYENNTEDIKRKKTLLQEIPDSPYNNVLDIGCGNGFITRDLPGDEILGLDLSENAIQFASNNNKKPHISYQQKNIFDLYNLKRSFDLVIITGVLYPQYIGASQNLIYIIIDKLLAKNGILVSVHINDWYKCRFPINLFKENLYSYKEYLHRMEVYQK